MDIFSHGLWAGAIAKSVNKSDALFAKIKRRISFWQAVFWGVAPDFFAFAIPFAWLIWNIIFGNMHFSDFPSPQNVEPARQDTIFVFRIASSLYNISHSLVIFSIVFGAVWLVLRRPVWEMGGWLFHVLIDIPTHSYRFFPTPFLWPISQWKFDGISWAEPWFMIMNYSALILVYLLIYARKKQR